MSNIKIHEQNMHINIKYKGRLINELQQQN